MKTGFYYNWTWDGCNANEWICREDQLEDLSDYANHTQRELTADEIDKKPEEYSGDFWRSYAGDEWPDHEAIEGFLKYMDLGALGQKIADSLEWERD
jgi:hypothetical protein